MDSRVPFAGYRDRVRPEWIDYNGHMNVARYVAAFDRATDLFLENLQMGPDYVRAFRASVFVVDMNVTYRRELRLGDAFYVTTQLLGHTEKKLRLFHQMFHQAEGYRVASNEVLLVHVDMEQRRAAPFHPHVAQLVAEVAAQHASLEAPEGAGRILSL